MFAAIVPVQRFDVAKTRLRVERSRGGADLVPNEAPQIDATQIDATQVDAAQIDAIQVDAAQMDRTQVDALARAMAADTLEVVSSTPLVGAVVVVSGDAAALELAEACGAVCCLDPRGGLNAAVMAGADS